MAEKELRMSKNEVEEIILSITKNGKEGKSNMMTSCRYLEEELRDCSQKEGVTVADSVRNTRSGLENTIQAVRSEGESEQEKVQCEILAHQENRIFQKKLREDRSEKTVEDWLGSCERTAWIGIWPAEQQEAWRKQICEVQTWRQVRGPAGAVRDS